MESKKIDALNIILILVSLWLAVLVPFRLFLFSYSILGPLHYLTEINWLQGKNYFIKPSKWWIVVLYILAVFISFYPVANFFNADMAALHATSFDDLSRKGNIPLLTSFLFSVCLIFFRKPLQLMLGLIISFSVAVSLCIYVPESVLVIGIFLPTIIHVFIFTLLFMIYGAIRSKSTTGIYASVLLLLIPFIISQMKIKPAGYIISPETWNTFYSSNMVGVSGMIAKLLGYLKAGKFNAMSEAGVRIQIFISFAYTYHYLNWFSKTSVIGWQKAMSARTTKLIMGIWILSIAIYMYDFKTGFMALFFLSFLHVFLEFPLNMVTMRELFSFARAKKE